MYKFENLIEEVKEFNIELKYGLDDIVGVTIEKGLIPTVANLTSTALDKFYLVEPETFVYNPRTHGVRLGMGYNETCNTYITSWNNVAFRVKKSARNIVLPQYLWLYFCRPIWDRITNFLAWGSSTIVFAWKDFLNIYIDLPSIERQREIVKEYETLSRRIRTNEQMIEKLEATAQALYRKMFVDSIDKKNLPEGWRMGTLSEVAVIKSGGDKPIDFSEIKTETYNVPIYANGIDNKGIFGYTIRPIIKAKSITISARGTIGYCFLRKEPYVPIVRLIVVAPHDEIMAQYLYHYLDSSNIKGSGSVQSQLTVPDMEGMDILIPPYQSVKDFNDKVEIMDKSISIYEQENFKLSELQSLLLAKMVQ